jgi:hypothetical protein
MTSQEKSRLLALLLDPQRWCQSAEARRADGQAVAYSDPAATAWDLTGALCQLFGWRRAGVLFIQIERRLHPRGRAGLVGEEAAIAAMIGLQSWNDDPQTSHPELLAVLGRLPVSDSADDGDEPSAAASPSGLDTGAGNGPPLTADDCPDGSVA